MVHRKITGFFAVGFLGFVPGCTDDSAGDGAGPVETGDADGAGDGDGDGLDDDDCSPFPPSPAPSGFGMSEPMDIELSWPVLCDGQDFGGLVSSDPQGNIPLEFEILHPTVDGTWPGGTFPIIIFSHGNNLYWDNYGELHAAMVGAGFIVANIKSGISSQTIPRGDRILCASRFIAAGAHVPDEVLEHWNGQFIFAGASTGGEGAVYAARRFTQLGDVDGPSDLIGIMAIAPSANQPNEARLLDHQTRSFFGIQGSRDGDVDERVFGLYDNVRTETVDSTAVDKVLIYSYFVSHAAWGGCNPNVASVCPTAKAGLLVRDFLVPYLQWIARGRLDQRASLADVPFTLSSELADSALWPESDGVPIVLRSFAVGTRFCGSDRTVIDSFSDFNDAKSDIDAPVSQSGFDNYTEHLAKEVTNNTQHQTGVARATWSTTGARISWEIPPPHRLDIGEADHLSLRMGNVTVRVPMTVFCSANPDFDAHDIAAIELLFDQSDHGSVMIDNLEFTRTSADAGAECFG
jgi:hypothetical protein